MKRSYLYVLALVGKYDGVSNMARRVRIHAPGAPHQIISREKERGERLAPEKHLLFDVERNA
jgi:hypothetical protein